MSSNDSASRASATTGSSDPEATQEDFSARCERLFREHNKALLGLLGKTAFANGRNGAKAV
jgi:hypothetical protein